jgi:hypothetical protein
LFFHLGHVLKEIPWNGRNQDQSSNYQQLIKMTNQEKRSKKPTRNNV